MSKIKFVICIILIAFISYTGCVKIEPDIFPTKQLKPVAAFTADKTTINTGQKITFSDQSTYTPTNWQWDYGDGFTSTVQNPTHIYSGSGTYTIKLTVTNSIGSNTITKTNYITVTAIQTVTVSDIDGNIYNTVTIGTQTWMKENLKVTQYNDGTAIPLVTDTTAWRHLQTPGYCWNKNNKATYGNTYGALYNWHTVNTGKLCPTGWHVPSDAEWTILTTYLGGDSVAGGKLKESGFSHWHTPNTATNESGFTALPGGFIDGGFCPVGYRGYWWSSTDYDPYAACVNMNRDSSSLFREGDLKPSGFSVRCVRDN